MRKAIEDKRGDVIKYIAVKKELMKYCEAKRDNQTPNKLSDSALKLLEFIGKSLKESKDIGEYVKIGKTVFFTMRITLASMSSAGSGNLFVTCLPVTVSASEPYVQQSVGYRTGWTTRAPDCSYTQPNYINLIYTVDTGIAFITTANLNGSIDLMISGFYLTTV